jgi:hypothetical protein
MMIGPSLAMSSVVICVNTLQLCFFLRRESFLVSFVFFCWLAEIGDEKRGDSMGDLSCVASFFDSFSFIANYIYSYCTCFFSSSSFFLLLYEVHLFPSLSSSGRGHGNYL